MRMLIRTHLNVQIYRESEACADREGDWNVQNLKEWHIKQIANNSNLFIEWEFDFTQNLTQNTETILFIYFFVENSIVYFYSISSVAVWFYEWKVIDFIIS